MLNSQQKKESTTLQENNFPTKRATVESIEQLLYEPLPVLDHGFIRVIDYMGDDAAIVQAARVSYGKGTKKLNQDAHLIKYLLRHWHTTPFEMCEIKFHIKLPLFVARQWIRHRTANINEYSARYSLMEDNFYIPSPEHLAAQSTINHQGRNEEESLSEEETHYILNILKSDSKTSYQHYQTLMNCHPETGAPSYDQKRKGLARELARMNLPVNIYTQWYWKIDLHNFMHFLMLRADSHAQYEIRAYAEAMLTILKHWVPITYEAFLDYRANAANISSKGMKVIKKLLQGEKPTREESHMSEREWQELMKKLDVI